MSNTKVIQRWFEEVWNKGNTNAIDELIAADCSIVDLDATEICCPADMKAFHAKMNAALDTIKIDSIKIVDSGEEKVAAIFTVNAIHRATGKPVSHKSAFVAEILDGKVSHAWNVVDFLTMFLQAGVLPPDAIARGMTSDSIH